LVLKVNNAMFNRYPERLGILPWQFIRLEMLAKKAASAQEKEHNEREAPSSDSAIFTFERYAGKLGLGVEWPGLYPVLVKDGEQVIVEWE